MVGEDRMSILSGILAALCFPKFNLSLLAWVALVPLFLEINKKENPREAAFSGFIFGIFFFGINLFWVNTLNEFVPGFTILGYILLVIYESAFTAAACYLIKYLLINLPALNILSVPLTWSFFEWLRTLGTFGISAGDLGYTQATVTPLIQIASFATVFGISFLIVMANAALADPKRSFFKISSVLVIIIFVYYWGLSQMPNIKPSPKSLTVSLIQGNIPQKKKLDAQYNNEILNIHEDLTRSILSDKPDIIIWPESFILAYLLEEPAFLQRVNKLAEDSKSYILIGTPYEDGSGKAYNSLVAFSPKGEIIGRYDKQNLVPFGEYLPLRFLFYPILKSTDFFSADFDFGPKEARLIEINGIKIGAVICFESTFVAPLKDRVKKGASLLLTVTNDAWFGSSSAAYEHLNCGIFRAVENRKYFIQTGNTGISAIIDPYGRILAKTNLNERRALTFKVPLP